MWSDELKPGWFGVEWRHLAALQAVAQEGSFAGAARRLGYTQPAISQQIAALERRVSGKLVDRSGSPNVQLTDAGERLVRHSAAIAARLQVARDDVTAAIEGRSARVRVGVFPSAGARLLPPLVRRYTEEWIGVQVSLSESWSDKEILERLKRGELDLAFALFPLEPGPFLGRLVMTDPYVLVCSPEFELADRNGALSLSELSGVPLLFLHEQRNVEALLREHGIEPNIVFRSDDNQTLLALAAEGLGAAIIPRLTMNSYESRVVEVPLAEDLPTRKIGLAWSSDRDLSPAAATFIDVALQGMNASLKRTSGGSRNPLELG